MFSIQDIPWCSNQTLSVNREKNRVHYIPTPMCHDSTNYISLNGEWDFHWFSSPLYVEQSYLEGNGYTDKITVPLNWQFAGYGVFHYTDEAYPFPMDPPYVPMKNECGVYHKIIQIDDSQESIPKWNYYLNFEGVESAFFVYVNGKNVGFNQGSRMHTEFDISPYLKDGANDVVVQVMQYSTATYLEDQDQWWLGGIIRDVYLLKRPKRHISNVNFDTNLNLEDGTGKLTITLFSVGDIDAELELTDQKGTSLFKRKGSLSDGSFMLEETISGVQGWSAESPHLYNLTVKTEDEIIPLKVGFRSLILKDGLLLWNGKRILMKGVNRHEFNAFTGRAVTLEQTRRELLLIKRAGMNAVRTAHYPNNPFFYELCDQIGLYVIDEADLETHGFEIMGEPTTLCEDPEWEKAYVDRVRRMVERDRNHVCVTLWSLGNESAYGRNFKAMYDWVKENEPIRPVHYEGDYKNQSIDVSSTMYSTVGRLAELDTNCTPKRPHILCEFGHAMGNGPGSLGEYFDLIENSKRIQGCFVWEFKDHGISRDIENKEEAYLYGGDFHEKFHNGQFCLDGLIRANGEPKPAFYEYQKVIEDIHVLSFNKETATLKVKNRMIFTDSSGITCTVRISKVGAEIESKTFKLPLIKPQEIGVIDLSKEVEFDFVSGKESYSLDLQFKKEVELLEEMEIRLMGSFSASVTGCDHFTREATNEEKYDIQVNEKVGLYEIEWGNNRLHIDKSTATITRYTVEDKLVMQQGPFLNLFRAYTDNDVKMEKQWKDMHLDSSGIVVYSSKSEQTENGIEIAFQCHFAPNGMNWGIKTSILYRVDDSGKVEMKINGIFKNAPDTHFPKIGTQLALPKSFEKVSYCGMGPAENYSDRDRSASLGIYKAKTKTMDKSYDYPQEYGNRTKVEWVNFYSESEKVGIAFATDRPVDFSVRPYSDDQLYEAKHSFELQEENKLYVNLDYKNSGLGSASCGPERLEQYMVYPLPFEYSIFFKPYKDEQVGDETAISLR
ncbi:MAG TPA: glycoside hydrolase family 2 TIM barrel-domain containing protein [Lachnospiraceae bacterium]|nr:glycoside hydrolase family 2 TIM barrel-domain containing protein [Lachnospiraceae bacterium]